MINIYMTSEAT